MPVIPEVSSWFDARKEALKRQIADAMDDPSAFLEQLVGQKKDKVAEQRQVVGDAGSVMPEVADPAKRVLKAGMTDSTPLDNMGGAGAAEQAILIPAARAMANGGHAAATKVADTIAYLINEQKMLGKPMGSRAVWHDSNQMLRGTPYNGVVPMQGRNYVELSDAGMNLKPQNISNWTPHQGQTIRDVLDHDALFQHAPELGMTPVEAHMRPAANTTGAFDTTGPVPSIVAHARHEGEMKDVLLHELQHGVQAMDRMPKGSNPNLEIYEMAQDPKLHALTGDQASDMAFQRYKNTLGEVVARIAEKRKRLTNTTAANKPYIDDILQELQGNAARVRIGGDNPWGTRSFDY